MRWIDLVFMVGELGLAVLAWTMYAKAIQAQQVAAIVMRQMTEQAEWWQAMIATDDLPPEERAIRQSQLYNERSTKPW